MRRSTFFATVVGIAVPLLTAVSAHAQATRTWVSGVGDDANPCSRTAPCKTFAGAISKTATNGEINCIDPGGFGALTITKGITLDCHEVYASILVSGTNGITINAAGAVVTIRNLNFNGTGTGINGINILAASKVFIEDAMIMQFTQKGISDTRSGSGNFLSVRNTTIRNNTGPAILAGAGATSNTVVENSLLNGNGFGIAIATGNNVMVSRSVLSGNVTAGAEVDAGGQLGLEGNVISSNGTGIQPGGTASLSNNEISFNGTGISAASQSYGNNRIFGNGSPGTAPTAASPGQQ
jgi:hypothetical protein